MLALLPPASSIRALAFHRRLPVPLLLPPPRTLPRLGPAPARSFMAFSAEPAPGEEKAESEEEPFPAAAGEKMRFGGVGSKLKGDFKDVEDKKHRAVYETLADSDQKLQYFSARQIGCRLLGSRGYLCQKCWLPAEDCMCANVFPCNLWRGMKFWLYMHPKDFLRQNNTGKLLWQVFGIQAAQLCLFGIQEHEDIMWDAFQRSGKGKISFLYPNKSTIPKSVKDLKFDGLSLSSDLHDMSSQDEPFNFILLDGTWSNSAALYRRLKAVPTCRLHNNNNNNNIAFQPQASWGRLELKPNKSHKSGFGHMNTCRLHI
uniref:tRNA-uridine aminocarboxypropyltransferase n=1 Tax=Setaria viridis TaxID=4556 RepID=A0A4U6V0P3_SETVI|nr:hypothetical protein SEVIR_4G125000v2 [Setaria viridis]